jgi:hypothetical protein
MYGFSVRKTALLNVPKTSPKGARKVPDRAQIRRFIRYVNYAPKRG